MRRLAALALLVAASPSPAAAQTVAFSVGGSLSAVIGDTIAVPVYVDMRAAGGARLGSYALRISWDPQVLSFVDVSPGSFGRPVANTDSVYTGVILIGGVSAAGLDGVFDVFQLRFIVYGASSPLDLTVFDAAAAGSLADLTPLVTAASGTFCEAAGRWGDLDRDGAANSRDALAILSNLVAIPVDTSFVVALGDADGDGLVNSRDALIILSYGVGLDVTGQRILTIAPGACGVGGSTLTILPDTLDLVVGQGVRPVVIGIGGSGTPAGAVLSWTVDDPTVAFVNQDGVVFGRDPGATTVHAQLGPGIRVSAAVVVSARRPVWYVDFPRAALATIQLGTLKYPVANMPDIFGITGEGDTIRVAPGTHEFQNEDCEGTCYPLTGSVVVLGDTLPNGTRPLILGTGYSEGFQAYDGIPRLTVKHLRFANLDFLLDGDVGTVLIENVEFVGTPYSVGLSLYNGVDTLVVRNSAFLTDSAAPGYSGIYLYDGADLVSIDSTLFRFWQNGAVFLNDADSVDIQASEFVGTGNDAVYIDAYNTVSGVGVYLARSRFVNNRDAAFGAFDLRSATLEDNVIVLDSVDAADALFLYGKTPARAGSRLVMRGDSIIQRYPFGTWVDGHDFDSVQVESVFVSLEQGGGSGQTYAGWLGANGILVDGVEIIEPVSTTALRTEGQRVTVRDSRFVGCDSCAFGLSTVLLSADAYGNVGPELDVDNTAFRRAINAIVIPLQGSQVTLRPVRLTNSTFDSVGFGMGGWVDGATVSDNSFGSVNTALQILGPSAGTTAPPGLATVDVRRNVITCRLGGTGVETQDRPLVADSNTVDCGLGIWMKTNWGPLTFRARGNTVVSDTAANGFGIYMLGAAVADLQDNRVTGGEMGIRLRDGVAGATHVLDSNVVEGSKTWGMYLSVLAGSVVGTYNNVKNNAADGVYADATGGVSFTNGRFVGNGLYAVRAPVDVVAAANNWWGNSGGAGGGVADSVLGPNIDTSSPLATDPEGASVPAAPPSAFVRAARAAAAVPRALTVPEPPLLIETPQLPASSSRPDPKGLRRQNAEAQRAFMEQWRAERASRRR